MSHKDSTFRIAREQYPARPFLVWPKRTARFATSAENSHYFFWARNAIYHSLKMFGVASGEPVLAPAYICRAAVEPIEAFGAKVQFYAVDRNCRIDFADLEAKIKTGAQALLAVHYFGFPQDIERLRELCDRHRLALIEDCAHVLIGQVNGRHLGSFGDASVFSYRKFLPMNDGAELRINRAGLQFKLDWTAESRLFQLKAAKSIIDRALDESPNPLARGIASVLERIKKLLRSAPKNDEGQSAIAVDQYGASFETALLRHPMTSPSRWILRHSDIAQVVRRRRENYSLLSSLLSRVVGVTPLVAALQETICPWVFPVFFPRVPDALTRLRALGVPAVSWNGVRPPAITRENFPAADFLYDSLVFLPIHQNLSESDMRFVAAAAESVANTAS